MNVKLTISEKLKDMRVERRLTLEELAKETGISRSTLGNYESNEYKDITHYSIIILAKYFGVSADYILGLTENRKEKNTPVEELHLDDDTIRLLKSGNINNRLLCEMVKHPDFQKFLADAEIYIDNIASMQINNLNAYVDAARQSIIEKYHPSENDPHMRLLEAAQISEDEYFKNRIHVDIDGIMADLKEAHISDTSSAQDINPLQEVKDSIKEAVDFEGSYQQKQIAFLCSQLGINYKSLTPEEFKVLMKAFSKSKKLKAPVRKRGRHNN
ncbi:MAG: helix-turn-helix transcriptional regulator [Eubacterium sp.]|nr:helix-turn-helix transcriptional regulator [Eubacterium sp.]